MHQLGAEIRKLIRPLQDGVIQRCRLLPLIEHNMVWETYNFFQVAVFFALVLVNSPLKALSRLLSMPFRSPFQDPSFSVAVSAAESVYPTHFQLSPLFQLSRDG